MKILLLGGSMQQVVAIEKAKEMGYYTILCDYFDDNPGIEVADKFYQVSTTDMDAVLEIAKKENIDGIVCYASDPAAVTQAYVAEKMGLSGNNYESVKILATKSLFRKFLMENGFNTPNYMVIDGSVEEDIRNKEILLKFPIMVKPVDSSGSKGVSKVLDKNELEEAIETALEYSRCKKVILEEYVDMLGYQVAGDGFSVDGKLVFACLGNDHFDLASPNPFVPVAASFPCCMSKRVQEKIYKEVNRVFELLKIKTGAYNFDIRVDKDENVYLMEIGPRNGGNYIPQVIENITGVDMLEYTIKAVMGEDCSSLKMVGTNGFYAYYSIHSAKEGIFDGIEIDDNFLEKHLVSSYLNLNIGDRVIPYTGSNKTIGILILKFKDMKEMLDLIEHISDYVKVVLK